MTALQMTAIEEQSSMETVGSNFGTLHIYHIPRNFGDRFNLAIWQFGNKSPKYKLPILAGQLDLLSVHAGGKFTLRLQNPMYYLLRE